MGCLYRLEFPNGKCYIGITQLTAEFRWRTGHVRDTELGFDLLLHRAIRKYGATAVKVQTLVIADNWGYLQLIEKRAVKVFNAKTPTGYNMTDGGDTNPMLDPEIAKRSAKSKKGVPCPWAKERMIHNNPMRNPESAKKRSGALHPMHRPEVKAKRAATILAKKLARGGV